MAIVRQDRRRTFGRATYLLTLFTCFFATASLAGSAAGSVEGWEIEQGVSPPSYAVIDPTSTNLNVDSVVLVCEAARHGRILQLQVYLSTEEPLAPHGVSPWQLKEEPRAEAVIDGRVFPIGMLFADGYVVLANEEKQMVPRLSESLLNAMQFGRNMTLRFDLVAEPAGQPADFDGEVVIDLRAGAGGAAVAAVRRCTEPGSYSSPGVASAER
ncbi:MAG: hypothetical protein ACHQK9_07935 [Reyranellales bacterium]